MEEQLTALLIVLASMKDDEADQFVFDKYVELYLDKGNEPKRMGVRKTHDGAEVRFTESRYEHAFWTTSNVYHSRAKDVFYRQRGERVAWIGPVIAGDIEGTQCWEVPPDGGRRNTSDRPWNRLYLVDKYVVWLEPSKQGGWWFSSAYVAGFKNIRRYCGLGKRIWTCAKKTP